MFLVREARFACSSSEKRISHFDEGLMAPGLPRGATSSPGATAEASRRREAHREDGQQPPLVR